MAWRTPTDAETAALIGTRIDGARDVERTGVGIVADVLDNDGGREVVA